VSAYPPFVLEGWELTDAEGNLGASSPSCSVRGLNNSSVGFDDSLLGRHVLFLGGIGTGKTVGMSALVESLRASAEPHDIFVFFDTKGDYLARFWAEGDIVISSDQTSPQAGHALWNFFSDLDLAQDPDAEVEEMAGTLFGATEEAAGEKNAIWPQLAKDLFAALVRASRRADAKLSNADIRRIADTTTVPQMHALIEPHEDLRGVLQYIAKEGSTTTLSVLIFMQQMIRATFKGAFGSAGDFSIRQFLRSKGGKAVFLEYDVAAGETVTPVFRTILDIALKESLGRNRASGRVFFVLDEFALLPKLENLDSGLNFGRSLGLRFVVGTQNVGQVFSRYGDAGGSSVLSGFGTVFTFRLYDRASRDFIRDRFGSNRKLVRFDAAVKSRGIAEERIDGSVIEDWDLSRLGVGQVVVALPDGPPHRFQFARPTEAPG
jgi:type IV secretory pathway TraG/TraD family ATPase VirD4